MGQTVSSSSVFAPAAAPDDPSNYATYVVAGDPDASLLIQKVEVASPMYGGQQMPLDVYTYEPAPMSSEDQAVYRSWVAEGALDNSFRLRV